MSIVVDFPAPFGPSSATVSPRGDRDVDPAHGADRPERLGEPVQLDPGRDCLPRRTLCQSGRVPISGDRPGPR